ncbi:MAG TPA: 1,4-alpha-glucan branching protein GlgB [Candidatus Goldiibacteriota bacterium]|nr:1,4-alpha-glucan branching protein GlgB [Candidatus Goldiibacteriota bacterium]HPN63936.1 1,4-alpha-glucan branching protein GlgB [Candidatus Goldiibacteriota bacterium]HRQ43607.1 1,4-alpha-glucan branching protein GlgB [Candidatus Goldiibacteriota bacterium]
MAAGKVVHGVSEFTEHDVYLYKEGNHFRLYEKMGSHVRTVNGETGVSFAVWAPNAKHVSVIGNFNGWDSTQHPLTMRWDNSGIWEGFIPGIGKGEIYKYHIVSHHNDYRADKGDPFGLSWEIAPKTASVIWDTDYEWSDDEWMKNRHKNNGLNSPMSIYEVHLGSWRKTGDGAESLGYKETAHQLADYCKYMGFTHVELMPVMEHPFFGSWGYQVVGFYAPTSRYGTPQDFMYFVEYMHKNGIGVILDWVPSHFPSDEYGLMYFDGTHLYEHADPRQGFHPDWGSAIFNYGRHEVKNFLISNALFWLDKYHVDGLRVDAVASMLYLDYSRKEGEWIPNKFGGRENIEAIDFLKKFNETVYKEYPDVQTIAEESTSWPMVTRPLYSGGLGFGFKWNMGWMNDTLSYFSKDPVYRKWHQNSLTFSMMYAFTENFMLPLSHDEVVHMKGSLIRKMPGDDWQKFANLRALLSYMWFHPGKKMLFMGDEFGQWEEWNVNVSLNWNAAGYYNHDGVKKMVKRLNELYVSEPALNKHEHDWTGFQWLDCGNYEDSVLSFVRKNELFIDDSIVVICNLTPVLRSNYIVGVPDGGFWEEIFNSDSHEYWGSNQGNMGGVHSQDMPWNGMGKSLSVTLPPLGVVAFKRRP